MASTLSAEFQAAMFKIYQRVKAEAHHNASVFFHMLNERGGVATAKALINAPSPSDTYTKLWELNRLDLTVEAEVAENEQWLNLFSGDKISRARERLAKYGYVPKVGR